MAEAVADTWFQKRTDEELRDIRKRLDNVVPRSEHELRWKNDDKNAERVEAQLDEVKNSLKDLSEEMREGHRDLSDKIENNEKARLQGQLPRWFVPTLALFVPIVTALVAHFVR